MKSISIENFTLESIEAATQNYKTLIGEGGFGAVYRGTLPDGQEVAVKVRSATSTQGTREFDNEVDYYINDYFHDCSQLNRDTCMSFTCFTCKPTDT